MIYVLLYRILVKTGLHRATRLKTLQTGIRGTFFKEKSGLSNLVDAVGEPYLRHFSFTYFGWFHQERHGDPEWFLNPFSNQRVLNPAKPWWKVAEFDNQVGDIKAVWEPSRLGWMIALARNFRLGDAGSLVTLNELLREWHEANPAFSGPNWRCAQEASVRVLHLVMTLRLLSGAAGNPSPALGATSINHVTRILSSLNYARAQKNNHIVVEAAALFCAPELIGSIDSGLAEKTRKMGRKQLERSLRRLVALDGAFSQYSSNYQRMVLDALCLVEVVRRWANLEPFSPEFYLAASRLSNWLNWIYIAEAKSVPNFGGNDGAHILNLWNVKYRDFSKSRELSTYLFGEDGYPTEGVNEYFVAMEVPFLTESSAPNQWRSRDLGLAADEICLDRLKSDEILVFFRRPVVRFRPPNSDFLHVDLWVGERNILRDAGTYSYAEPLETIRLFHGVAGHNTIEFDQHDQMSMVGRFLYSSWVRRVPHPWPSITQNSLADAYQDSWGNFHARMVTVDNRRVIVTDAIRGKFEQAILRWRLIPGGWIMRADGVELPGAVRITVRLDTGPQHPKIMMMEESLLYHKTETVPVLHMDVSKCSELTTVIEVIS